MSLIVVLALFILASTGANADTMWQRYTNTGCVGDPLHKHCCDVTVNTSDPHAVEWKNANAYVYVDWKQGLCDSSVYPTVESKTHPPGSDQVTLRKLGHATEFTVPETTVLEVADTMWQRYTNTGCVGDPLHAHCCDVTVNTSDSHAVEWKNANAYVYVDWKQGLCDSSVYPTIESKTHPPGSDQVTLRKLGHAEVAVLGEFAEEGKLTDCRSNKASTPIPIKFTNAAGTSIKIRGCLDQYACKPYRDCDVALPAGADETVTIDSSFKYFVFTYHGLPTETELYPDANLKYPPQYTVKGPKIALSEVGMPQESVLVVSQDTPGNHAHCVEVSFYGGTNNPYYQAHGYQYAPPSWSSGPCAKKYNWFNKNETIAKDVVQTLLGVHTA